MKVSGAKRGEREEFRTEAHFMDHNARRWRQIHYEPSQSEPC
jgi:hypothetical protein